MLACFLLDAASITTVAKASVQVNDKCLDAKSINVNTDVLATFITGGTTKNKCGSVADTTKGLFYTFGTSLV